MINTLNYFSSVQFGGTLYCERFESGVTNTSRHFGATQSVTTAANNMSWRSETETALVRVQTLLYYPAHTEWTAAAL